VQRLNPRLEAGLLRVDLSAGSILIRPLINEQINDTEGELHDNERFKNH
jgi:hypothetical protein